ncbi:nucleotide sugar dehydrogenase [bacterium]|nr:nucleotide sugar dehydrogenase [bacterium]
MSYRNSLVEKFQSKSATVAVIGLGYVGLPLLLRFVEVGFKVIGIDVHASKVDALLTGKSYIRHIPSDRLAKALATKRVQAGSDYALTAQADAIIICVPTPLNEHREPDLSYITNTMEALVPFLKEGQLLSLESTTYPGTTAEEIVPRVERSKLKVGQDAFVVFSPEREDPGNQKFETQTIPKVVGGTTKACLDVGVALYSQVIGKVVPVTSTQTAEMAKLLENIYRSVNIGLVNELKQVADRMNIDIWEVIEAASTKPFGFTPFFPGPGLGGHCIPIDPFYLTWKAREYGVNTRFIELAGEVNTAMPEWVYGKVAEALNSRSKAVRGSRILLLGTAYKKNIDDMRESPALRLFELLTERGASVSYSDPFVPSVQIAGKTQESVKMDSSTLKNQDCVLLVTDHDSFDYKMILEDSSLIVDTRGRFRNQSSKVVPA